MNVVYVFGENWIEYVKIQLYSLLLEHSKYLKDGMKVYLISDTLTQKQIDDFYEIVEYFRENNYQIKYLNLSNMYEELLGNNVNVEKRYTKYTMYRLLIPKVIDDDYVLYLDTDTLVCGELYGLYNNFVDRNKESKQHKQNIHDKPYLIGGVVDSGVNNSHKQKLNMANDELYINAGVMLMNLAEIRKNRLHEQWINLANTTYYDFHDQDIINKTCVGKILEIDNRYNVSVCTGLGLNVEVNNIKIMHYAGDKPWNKNDVFGCELWEKKKKEFQDVFNK
jgi:lipopolysaccharide biosynthesis glycosyltransferase